jgi:hypothetical protein
LGFGAGNWNIIAGIAPFIKRFANVTPGITAIHPDFLLLCKPVYALVNRTPVIAAFFL